MLCSPYDLNPPCPILLLSLEHTQDEMVQRIGGAQVLLAVQEKPASLESS